MYQQPPRTIKHVSDKYQLSNAVLYGQLLINGINYIYDKCADELIREDVHLQRVAQQRNAHNPQLGLEI